MGVMIAAFAHVPRQPNLGKWLTKPLRPISLQRQDTAEPENATRD